VSKRPLRIFIGLQEIADYYVPLQAALEDMGHDVVLITLVRNPLFGLVAGGPVPAVARIAMAAAERDAQSVGRPLPVRLSWWVAARFLRLPVLLWAIATRDVFVFGYASTFCLHLELPLLKLLRKRVVCIFHGTDSRPPYMNGAVTTANEWEAPEELARLTRRTKRRVRKIDRWADVVIDNPLSSHFHERTVVSFLAVGIPQVLLPETPRKSRNVVRVLHCPSRRRAKGSDAIRAAVERLQARGLALELIELSGVAHDDVLDALGDVDAVVDQLYSDTALAGFAGEAAAAGLPVIVGGYGLEEIKDALCGGPLPPVLFCQPDELDATLERLVTDSEMRRELGRSARRYVESELRPSLVAQRLVDVIEGVRPDWLFDPRRISYVHGFGLAESEARMLVRATIACGGVSALCLGDKPALEARFVEFAGDAYAAQAGSGKGAAVPG